ncbi:MAG TPA: hypothetical protein VG816_01910 [Solirubrobacterales bacterium]|nr:hypothetical protein [Solirubrobacterales bacterium]
MLPDAPIFLAQQTYRGRAHNRLGPVGKACVSDSRQVPGVLLDFGAVHLRGIEEDASKRSPLSPMVTGCSGYGIETKQNVPMAPWIQRSAPSTKTEWDSTIRESIEQQRKLGVDAIVTPGAELTSGAYPNGLSRQIDAVRRAWLKRPQDDLPWLAEVYVHDDWIVDQSMRRFALNVITDLPDDIGVCLHVRFAKRDAAYNAPSLEPLRDMVEVLADDGRKVLVMQSGIVGWLSIAWGAWGFSAGMSQGSWLDHRTIIRRRAGAPSPPRVERYFEPQLLHSVLAADHNRFTGANGYVKCECAFCKSLTQAANWDHTAAAQHDLYALAGLTEKVKGVDRAARRNAVRTTIETAQNTWAQWKAIAGLSNRAEPTELSVWRGLV